MESDEFIKSSVEKLISILSESEGIPDNMCDVPFHDNSLPLDVSKDQFEDFSDSIDEFSSTDDDSFSIDNIEYVEASPPDSELIGSEVMEIVILEGGGIDDDILITIKDDILREKLLNINILIANIEALNDNPTSSSDFMTNSGSTTTRSDIPLLEYEAFYDDHVKEISSGSTTTHSDSSLYDSFIFDLSINPFPPANRSDFYEFADELTHIISPPEYDCFFFKIEPNSGDFTMDVVEDISPIREPRVKDNKEKDKIKTKPDKIKSKREARESLDSRPTKSKPSQSQESIKETFKATKGELLLDTYIRYLQVINELKKCGYSKDNCKLNFKFLNNLQPEWKQYETMMRQNKNLIDINIDALYNILKQNQRDVNDAMRLKKKNVMVTSDPFALIVKKTKVNKSKEKVVVSLDFEGSGADDFSELKKITALLAKTFNRRKLYFKTTNNNLRTSSTSQFTNKKQEFVKSDDKKVEKKDDEKKQDTSKVKCNNWKKEGHFSKDYKKAKVKDYNYYKTKMLLAKKDSDKQVLLAVMESSSDSDQEINANIVFMAQIEKVLS
nr:hypothetical protein [Tanacetum cinerariifolium]